MSSIEEVKQLVLAGKLKDAMVKIDELIQVDSENVEFLNMKGFLLNNVGDYSGAQVVLEKAINLGCNSKVYNNLGLAFEGIKMKNEAKLAFEKAINLDKYDLYSYFNLASFFIKEKQYKLARSILLDAKKIKMDSYLLGFYLESFLVQFRLHALICMVVSVILAIPLKHPIDYIFIAISSIPLALGASSDFLRRLNRSYTSLIIAILFPIGVVVLKFGIFG